MAAAADAATARSADDDEPRTGRLVPGARGDRRTAFRRRDSISAR
jgi:hypothetical protein